MPPLFRYVHVDTYMILTNIDCKWSGAACLSFSTPALKFCFLLLCLVTTRLVLACLVLLAWFGALA